MTGHTRSTLALLTLAVLSTALAAKTTVTVAGQTVTVDSTTVNGQTYINLQQLQKALGAAGGANQGASVTGCLNQPLFNGIWRLRVTKIEAITDPTGGTQPVYHLLAQLSNGTTKTLAPSDTGVRYSNAYNVFLKSGDSIAAPTSTSVAFLDKTSGKLPQGGATTLEFIFYPKDGRSLDQLQADLPQKFLFEVKPELLDKDLKVGYTVKDPSFRVNLTCSK